MTLSPPILTEAKVVPLPDVPEPARQLYEKWMNDSFPNTKQPKTTASP